MLGKMVSLGFGLATLPARMTYRSVKAVATVPGDLNHLRQELAQFSGEVAREIQHVLESVDAEMRAKSAHLNPSEKQQAAELAISAAEQHLSMAAVNVLRALWLSADANRSLEEDRKAGIIEHES
ncbi:MAG: hypothetical protein AAF699_09780 [Pseudomonadota bacterium]